MKIALVEWNWVGHHPTWFNILILALEDLGVDVVALCPYPEEAAKTASASRPERLAGAGPRGRTEFVKLHVSAPRFPRIWPTRINSIDFAIRRFAGIDKQVRACASGSAEPITAIFYNCIYDWDFLWFHWAAPWLRLPWVGLYLHAIYPPAGAIEQITRLLPAPTKKFRGHLCKGIAILNEVIVDQFAHSIGKLAVALPDISDERHAVTAEDRALGEQLKRFAAGRPIVGLFGHLKKSKGVLTFLEVAQMPEAAGICFALAGEMIWSSVPAEADQIRRALAKSSNIWSHLERIPTEPCFNELLATSDVIFAAYWDFPHSSGIITKAATLGKPLIVSDGQLMAARVRRFNLGEIIPQGDARALLAAILKMTNDPGAWSDRNQPRYADFCQEHSVERLKQKIKELLACL